jgi:trk system potassium uptake protein TrkH
MARADTSGFLTRQPLFLLFLGCAALSMYLPAAHAVVRNDHPTSQSFFYAGTLGLFLFAMLSIVLSSRRSKRGLMGQLMALMAGLIVLPAYLAVPFHDALGTTRFVNAYVEMVSALTTTGATLFPNPDRLNDTLHLWRAQVGWMGGFMMWVAASAILAPLSLGGFEVTAMGEPGRGDSAQVAAERAEPGRRLMRITRTLAPIYAGLTAVLWLALLLAGDRPLVALCHAMSVMATSGISPVGGLENSAGGLPGEAAMALFMLFALSRLTFSGDTMTKGSARLDRDPEVRIGLLIVVTVPVALFLRHWFGAYDLAEAQDIGTALRALWGSVFTVLSFLTTSGFASAEWDTAREWSGLGTPGVLLMGLAIIGGGVATTAGGVKLLRVYALYLNGLREMERLVHPSSVGSETGRNARIKRDGAFIAWIFFMIFALTLAAFTVIFAFQGLRFEDAMLLTVAALTTTGPLIDVAGETPLNLIEIETAAKLTFSVAMILGRLETLAFIALLSTRFWRA